MPWRGVKKHKYFLHECARAVFHFGWVAYEKERPPIGKKKLDPWTFMFDGVPVKFKEVNHQDTWRVTCPQCGKEASVFLKYPEPGARWGCRKCVPHSRYAYSPRSIHRLLSEYSIDEIMKLPVKRVEEMCGQDAISVIQKIIAEPEGFWKSPFCFRNNNPPIWTDDLRIPLVQQAVNEKNARKPWKNTRLRGCYRVHCKISGKLVGAIDRFAYDNGMTRPHAIGSILKWAMLNPHLVQVRKI